MALQAATIVQLDQYWADFFHVATDEFSNDGTLVVPHVGLGDYHGLWLFRRNQALIVSVPVADYAFYQRELAALTPAILAEPTTLPAILRNRIDRLIGPAWIGYRDRIELPHDQNAISRLLRSDDAGAYQRFRAAVPALDWDHGGNASTTAPLVGSFIDDTLVALASYELWGDAIAHISIVTHPGYRGHGYGRSAVALITQVALERGFIPQYRTLQANTPSLHIARQLGFVAYAEYIAIRLR